MPFGRTRETFSGQGLEDIRQQAVSTADPRELASLYSRLSAGGVTRPKYVQSGMRQSGGFTAFSASESNKLDQYRKELSEDIARKLREAEQADFDKQTAVGQFGDYVSQTAFDRLNPFEAEEEAVRGVEQEFAGARQRELRELGRLGISPTAGRARSSQERRALNLALARSGARLEARKSTEAANLEREKVAREQALELRGQDITRRGQDISLRASGKYPTSTRLSSRPSTLQAPITNRTLRG